MLIIIFEIIFTICVIADIVVLYNIGNNMQNMQNMQHNLKEELSKYKEYADNLLNENIELRKNINAKNTGRRTTRVKKGE
jgi:glucose-6-phosphate-specific signal transduction histidine kinase